MNPTKFFVVAALSGRMLATGYLFLKENTVMIGQNNRIRLNATPA